MNNDLEDLLNLSLIQMFDFCLLYFKKAKTFHRPKCLIHFTAQQVTNTNFKGNKETCSPSTMQQNQMTLQFQFKIFIQIILFANQIWKFYVKSNCKRNCHYYCTLKLPVLGPNAVAFFLNLNHFICYQTFCFLQNHPTLEGSN